MTEETGAVDSPQSDIASVEETSTDELRAMMTVTEPPEAEQPEQPETETETAAADPEETEEERHAKRRIRPKSALDQQVLDLYKSEAFDGTFADASRIIYNDQGDGASHSQQETADTRPDPLDRFDTKVSEIQQEIASLEEQVTEAADNLETSDALKLQREITRRELEVQRLSVTKETEIQRRKDSQYNTHRDKAMESRDRALEQHPELQDKESIPRKQFDEFVQVAQKNPDYASIFESPLWPEFMAREFTAMVQGHQQPAPEVPSQQPPAMGTQAKVLTTGSTDQPANAPVTAEQVVSNMGQMSNEQLYALLGQDDGRKAPLR